MKRLLYCCWLLALIGCGMSLYYGEILVLEPCRACWYQRIALFPIAVILGVGIYRDEISSVYYTLPFSVFGGLVALVQAASVHHSKFSICTQGCSDPGVYVFGWLSLPFLSAMGFAAINVLLFLICLTRK